MLPASAYCEVCDFSLPMTALIFSSNYCLFSLIQLITDIVNLHYIKHQITLLSGMKKHPATTISILRGGNSVQTKAMNFLTEALTWSFSRLSLRQRGSPFSSLATNPLLSQAFPTLAWMKVHLYMSAATDQIYKLLRHFTQKGEPDRYIAQCFNSFWKPYLEACEGWCGFVGSSYWRLVVLATHNLIFVVKNL